MKVCIYCRRPWPENSKGVEHVIPRSFGTFGSKTPTLRCVCDECNSFFKKELDQVLARDTLEGITRYKKGLPSREARHQKGLLIALPKTEEFGEFGGVVVWINGTTSKVMPPPPQVHFKRTDDRDYEVILRHDLNGLDWKSRGFTDKDIKLFAPSEEEHQGLIEDLKKIGINYKLKSTSEPSFIKDYRDGKELPLAISASIGHVVKRALVKILFNFAAYYIGYSEVMKQEWDKARNYVRFNSDPLKGRASNKPFWGEETETLRFKDDAYNLRIENQSGNLIGAIQFFNLFLYEFILAEGYSIPERMEVAARFKPGEEPYFGKKQFIHRS